MLRLLSLKKYFENGNISWHVIFVLKLYMHLFHFFGFLGLEFNAQRYACRLTNYSTTISRGLGVLLSIWTCLIMWSCCHTAMTDPMNLPLSVVLTTLALNQSLLLLRSKRAVKRRVAIINRFLQIVQKLRQRTGRELKLSALTSVQVVTKFVVITHLMIKKISKASASSYYDLNIFHAYMLFAIGCSLWHKEIANHVYFIGLKIVEKSYIQLNLELDITNAALKQTLCMHNLHAARALSAKIIQLRLMYADLLKLSKDLTKCIETNLLFSFIYDMAILLALVISRGYSFTRWWQYLPTMVLCLNSLRGFCSSFEEIVQNARLCSKVYAKDAWQRAEFGYGLPLILAQLTTWVNIAAKVPFDEKDRLQDHFLPVLLQPDFTLFGMIPLNKNLFFRIFFSYFSFCYIYLLCKTSE